MKINENSACDSFCLRALHMLNNANLYYGKKKVMDGVSFKIMCVNGA